jgi:hypothetical protein
MPQQFMLKRALQQCFVGLNYFYHNKHAIDFFCLPEKKVHKPSTVGMYKGTASFASSKHVSPSTRRAVAAMLIKCYLAF